MKKKVISIILIGTMVHSIFACGSIASKETGHDEIDEPVQEESSESGTVQEKEVYEETEDTLSNSELQQAADDESAEPIYIIEPQLTQNDMYEMQDWQAAYAEYIEGLEWKENYDYSLIYVNDDDIPELVIDTGMEANGCYILTYHNGEVDALRILRLNFYYIEKKNLVNNSDGHMGYYYDYIYSIENGKWVYVAGGEWTETYIVEDDDLVYQYEWEGESVEEEVYKAKLDAIFDGKQAKGPEQYEKSDEMLFRLQMGTAQSQTHRYELYVEDITWDEAKRRCEERGGYLATIKTLEEYEYIKKGIEDSGQTQIAYWIGASDRPASSYGYRWHEPNWSSSSYEYTNYIDYSLMKKYWADGEPGYSRQVSDEPIERLCIYLLYDDAKENCYLYNAPKDMLMRNPEYTGKIGYICEYGVTVKVKETHYDADGSVLWWDEYGFDDAGNQTEEIEYDADGSVDHWTEYEYDSAGNRIKNMEYKADGSIDSRYEREYDDAGNLVKEISRTGSDYIRFWYEYEYDSVGNLIKEIGPSTGGRVHSWVEYKYDSAGNTTERSVRDNYGDTPFKEEYEYDSMGNEIKMIRYKNDNIEMWSEYEYNSAGNKIKSMSYNADGRASSRSEMEYDSAGNRTQEIGYDCADGSITYWKECVYDNTGNLTQEIYYDEGGSVEQWYKHEYDSKGNITKTYCQGVGSTGEYEYEREYENMGNLTKYMEYRQGEIYEWYEREYITIGLQ